MLAVTIVRQSGLSAKNSQAGVIEKFQYSKIDSCFQISRGDSAVCRSLFTGELSNEVSLAKKLHLLCESFATLVVLLSENFSKINSSYFSKL